MKITVLPLDQFKRPERNVRHHPQKQIEEMKRSLTMFKQTRPMVVDEEYTVLVGNGMLTAMEQLGWTEAECYVYEGLSSTQKKKLMLADNRVYDLGLTDMDAFDAILQELAGDTDIPGWDEALLKTLTASVSEVDDLIGSYGTYPAEEIDSLARRERDDYVSPPEAHAAYSPVATPSVAPQYAPMVSNTNVDAPQPVQRFVICPKCGEKIPLGGA
ncbi:MAG: ParB N-terminal domain-containing protein [Clostridia bacterium]|nr:ParB N-terminal domain-containing protein [Clostridia bacterium]